MNSNFPMWEGKPIAQPTQGIGVRLYQDWQSAAERRDETTDREMSMYLAGKMAALEEVMMLLEREPEPDQQPTPNVEIPGESPSIAPVRYEYKLLAGILVDEDGLNQLGSEGFRVVGTGTIVNQWNQSVFAVVMERAVIADDDVIEAMSLSARLRDQEPAHADEETPVKPMVAINGQAKHD